MDCGTEDNVDMLQCHNCQQMNFSDYLDLNKHMESCLANLTDDCGKRQLEVFKSKGFTLPMTAAKYHSDL